MIDTTLSTKMRAWAVAHDNDDRRFVLVARADEFDHAVARRAANPGSDVEATKKMLGAWARARKAWCDVSGEDLI